MNAILENRWVAAIVGALLLIPGILLFTQLDLNIEPPMGPLEPYLRQPPEGGPHVLGSLIAFNAIVVFPVTALILNFAPIMRGKIKDGTARPVAFNIVVATAASLIVLAFVGAIAVDQYPCLVGVPNCD